MIKEREQSQKADTTTNANTNSNQIASPHSSFVKVKGKEFPFRKSLREKQNDELNAVLGRVEKYIKDAEDDEEEEKKEVDA